MSDGNWAKRPIVGIVTPPAWFDPGPKELVDMMDRRVAVQQTILSLEGFDYNILKNFADSLTEMKLSTQLLAAAGCDVVMHTGTPFSFAGVATEAGMRRRILTLQGESEALVVMAGTAILDALRVLKARSIAVATPYYQPEWQAAWAEILASTEFEVLAIQSLDQQGLSEPITNIHDMGWSMTDDLVLRSMAHLYRSAPMADVYVLTGAGSRTSGMIEKIEAVCGGKPVVASDSASFWAVARALNMRPHVNPFGLLGARESNR